MCSSDLRALGIRGIGDLDPLLDEPRDDTRPRGHRLQAAGLPAGAGPVPGRVDHGVGDVPGGEGIR